ncbi:spindle pole body interacting protein [Violaceomyces palustris]|uniref:Spindle pole body interacting protein n=1 Tax=Violaceomyces palustris TaxID=1673888 RepID=A0ACD0NUA4_9BASI|nr:spindle pole body interacting protein [Violaceomyces palustris]
MDEATAAAAAATPRPTQQHRHQKSSSDPSLLRTNPPLHCQFVLLAEFDIDKGSTLSHQYPNPTGHDEHMLAELMLPDGAHARVEDWTIFFLKSPKPSKESTGKSQESQARTKSMEGERDRESGKRSNSLAQWSSEGLTYVINLVRTKHDTSVRRGALVKSMAIGTRHPFIEVFKPALLLALDDYFNKPGVECLARLYDAINQLDLTGAPTFSRAEKLILRASDRRDLFEERFQQNGRAEEEEVQVGVAKRVSGSTGSAMPRNEATTPSSRSRAGSSSTSSSSDTRSIRTKPSQTSLRPSLSGRRRSSAASVSTERRPSQPISPLPTAGRPKDTHFFETSITYRQILLPIRLPLTVFPEEVGEYSLIKFIQTFSGPTSTPVGPLHPHLHTNGNFTHPIILLFNALVTQKRVVFLGHGQPASLVASYVLAACALGSGCGAVFRGFASRTFPYTNLMNLDDLEKVPGYIAGVTNPRFEDLHAWDVLCNVETGKITVSRDIPAASASPVNPRPAITRDTFSSSSSLGSMSGGHHETLSGSKASTEIEGSNNTFGVGGVGVGVGSSSSSSIKSSSINPVRERNHALMDARPDAPNNIFMEDILGAIQSHYGERYIRARITDFCAGFARAVSRHEEHFYGHTTIGPASQPFLNGQLGSGAVYLDRETELKEIQANQMRAEGFRASIPFKFHQISEMERTRAIKNFDAGHQIARLKRARQLAPGESDLIFETIAKTVRTSEQITELLSFLPPHGGGLLPLGFGLLHPSPYVREWMVDFFLHLCSHPVGKKFVQGLNTYQRLALARLAHERNERLEAKHHQNPNPNGTWTRTTTTTTNWNVGSGGGHPFGRSSPNKSNSISTLASLGGVGGGVKEGLPSSSNEEGASVLPRGWTIGSN